MYVGVFFVFTAQSILFSIPDLVQVDLLLLLLVRIFVF
jgi:hypothetical protein